MQKVWSIFRPFRRRETTSQADNGKAGTLRAKFTNFRMLIHSLKPEEDCTVDLMNRKNYHADIAQQCALIHVHWIPTA